MFNKIIRDILIVFGFVIIYISTSRTAMQFIVNLRDNDKWWGMDQMDKGDLASMSYLDFKYGRVKESPIPRSNCNAPKRTDLYLYGDSYTQDTPDSVFCGLLNLHFGRRYFTDLKYHLDTTHKNVIIFELTERTVRDYYRDLRSFNEVYDPEKKNKSALQIHSSSGLLNGGNRTRITTIFPDFQFENLFNKNINQNMECNLFNYNFIIPMFQTKAMINLYLFNRASGDVVISKNRQCLFYKETVAPSGIGSSYYPLQDGELKSLITNLNLEYDHYKNEGFNEVYLSIIPNSASIMQPENYNNLVPLIQNDPQLKMKVIDVYTAYKNSKELCYHPGDIHWNKHGKQEWLKIVNTILEDMNTKN